MNIRQIATLTLAIGLAALVEISVAEACPTCKAGFGDRQVNAFGWSILFMMAMPFTLIGAFAAYVYWSIRSQGGEVAASATDESVAAVAERKLASGVPTQPPVDA